MSDTEYTWLAFAITGLGLTTLALLLTEEIPSYAQYSAFALAVLFGVLAVWHASRNRSTA